MINVLTLPDLRILSGGGQGNEMVDKGQKNKVLHILFNL